MSMLAVVHVDDSFTVGLKSTCDRFCGGLNSLVPINNPGELSWPASGHYSKYRIDAFLTIRQKYSTD